MKTLEQKRKEAQERQVKYNALSLALKIKRAENRPGNAEKEISRLRKLQREKKNV